MFFFLVVHIVCFNHCSFLQAHSLFVVRSVFVFCILLSFGDRAHVVCLVLFCFQLPFTLNIVFAEIQSMNKKFKISFSYNAPVTLSYTFLCALILVLNYLVIKIKGGEGFIQVAFTAKGSPFEWKFILAYIRLFTHVLGHSDWNHFLGNFAFIILLGPIVEERYGSKILALMMMITAFVSGVVNECMIPKPLLGASGIVFMLIILSSISSLDKKKIPASFVCVILIFIGREVYNGLVFHTASLSVVASIVGGLCGSLFGFMVAPKARRVGVSKRQDGQEGRREEPSERASYSRRTFYDDGTEEIPVEEFSAKVASKLDSSTKSQSPKKRDVLSFRGKGRDDSRSDTYSDGRKDDSEVVGTIEL